MVESNINSRDDDWCIFANPRIDVNQDEYLTLSRILIDFGPSNDDDGRATAGPDVNGNYWNSWRPYPGNHPIPNGEIYQGTIVDTNNNATNIGLIMTNSFDSNGRVNGGLLSPDAELLGDLAVPTATEDYWFESVDGGAVRISGLDPNLFYDLRILGSRESEETRITRYTAVDSKGSQAVDLQTSGNGIGNNEYDGNNDMIVGFTDLRSNIDGDIYLDVSIVEGGYAYLNLLEITVKSKIKQTPQ
jgi:hypothetical protein